MDTTPNDSQRRGNYDSGEDFVLEYGELRFTFNERDFSERCEQAARKLGFVRNALESPEREDLRSEEHTSELQSRQYLVCRLLLEKKQQMSSRPRACQILYLR